MNRIIIEFDDVGEKAKIVWHDGSVLNLRDWKIQWDIPQTEDEGIVIKTLYGFRRVKAKQEGEIVITGTVVRI